MIETWENILKNIPQAHWRNYVEHTEKVILDAWSCENRLNRLNIEPMVINISEDDDDSSSFEESDID